MLILIAPRPLPQPTTLDRYLILAKQANVSPLIGIGKCDLEWPQNKDEQLTHYASLGYPLFRFSAKTKIGLPELQQVLKGETTIIVGQSGVGKSTLLTLLMPDIAIRTQALSQKNRLGQQTTTATTLYHLPEGGNIIDSPGIHQLNLHHLTQDKILAGYEEFLPYLGHCQFRNCQHNNEPGCALQNAVTKDLIPSFRLENYHRILASQDESL